MLDKLIGKKSMNGIYKDVHEVNVWCDTGKHFKSRETAYSLLRLFPKRYQADFKLHYFGESHGKNPLDACFSLLSRWLKESENEKCINSTDALINAWKEKVEIHGKKSKFSFQELTTYTSPKKIKKLKFANMSCYYFIHATDKSKNLQAKVLSADGEEVTHVIESKDAKVNTVSKAKKGKQAPSLSISLNKKISTTRRKK
jgi:hypothetical protein